MILSDREIEAALDNKFILIDPRPQTESIDSTAIDLTLDKTLLLWKTEIKLPPTGSGNGRVRPHSDKFNIRELMRHSDYAETVIIDAEKGYDLNPGRFVLGYTIERITLPPKSRIAARVEGKSSLARLGMGVHITAPTIHAGFGYNADLPDDQQPGAPIQLEIVHHGTLPIVLDIGMAVCQLILEEVRETPSSGYRGQFRAQEHFSQQPLAKQEDIEKKD